MNATSTRRVIVEPGGAGVVAHVTFASKRICSVMCRRLVLRSRQRIVRIIEGWPGTDALLGAYRCIALIT